MSAEENKAVIARLYEEVFRNWRTSLIDELFRPDFSDHMLNLDSGESPSGPHAVHQLYGNLRNAFPDLAYQVHDIIAEDDKVVVRWTWTCTHLGNFRDIDPTGKKAEVAGIAIYRLIDERIVERWVSTNLDQLAQNLGAEHDS